MPSGLTHDIIYFMKRNFKKSYILSIVLITMLTGCAQTAKISKNTSLSAAGDRRTISTFIDDQAISMKAGIAIIKDPELRKKSHISLLSYNNSLLMVGQAPDKTLKLRAEQLLEKIPEIENIYNEVSITSPITLKKRAKDAWITTQVKTKLTTAKMLGPNKIKVITENGTVYLMGLLTKKEEEVATNIVEKIKNVVEIVKIFDTYEKSRKS